MSLAPPPGLTAGVCAALGVSRASLHRRRIRLTVDLTSDKNGRTFRTNLREAAKEKPNFAGEMILTTWGCGSSCQAVALINARNGKVTMGPSASYDVTFHLESRLLVVNADPVLGLPARHFVWEHGRLAELEK